MATIAPWLQPARPVEAASAGSEAGLGLRRVREQAAASLRQHQLGLAQIAARKAGMQQEAAQQNAANAMRERLAAQEYDIAGQKLREDARQADLMAKFNEAKLAKGEDGFTFLNTAAGPVRVNKQTGEWEIVPGMAKDKNAALTFLKGGGQGEPQKPVPAGEALKEKGGARWYNPFSWFGGGDETAAPQAQPALTNAPATAGQAPGGFRLLSAPTNQVQGLPRAQDVDENDPLGLGIGQ